VADFDPLDVNRGGMWKGFAYFNNIDSSIQVQLSAAVIINDTYEYIPTPTVIAAVGSYTYDESLRVALQQVYTPNLESGDVYSAGNVLDYNQLAHSSQSFQIIPEELLI
jgi:hypothetical protein